MPMFFKHVCSLQRALFYQPLLINRNVLISAGLLLNILSGYAQPDMTKPVGTIPGSVSVSMGGAAVYNIPVQVPSGVGGLQPEVSLTYNSQAHDGIAGYGWSLSGLSVITRGAQTKYYNGVVRPMSMNQEDNFYLDGQVLIPTAGTNGGDGTQYSLERETFLKIESFGGFDGNPDWWRITQKDGSTTEYGKRPEDKLAATVNVAWMISQSADVNNNLLTYSYQALDGEVVLERISYGNNAVSFEYGAKENKNVIFENGKKLVYSRLLTNISIIQDGITKQHLALHHTQEVKRSYLTNAELFGTDGQSFVTMFDYGSITQEEAGSAFQGTYEASGHNWSLTPGDYDGDGKSDLVVANILYKVEDNEIKSTSSSLYNLITNVAIPNSPYSLQSSKFELQTTYPSNTYVKVNDNNKPYAYLNMDMDGDGKEELLRIGKNLNKYQDSRGDWHDNGMYFIDNISIDKFTGNGHITTRQTTTFPIPSDYTDTYKYYLKDANSIIGGDFDGDGSVDIINILGAQYQSGEIIERKFNIFNGWYIYRITPVYDYTFKGFFTNKLTGEINVEIQGLTNQLKDAKGIYPIDFNGDGKQELLVLKATSFIVYSIDRTSPSTGSSFLATQIHASYQIGHDYYKKILIGDFNGDKKTDIIAASNSINATLLYSTGIGFARATLTLKTTPNFASAWPDRILTGDFNGDGVTDIMHAYQYPVGSGGSTTYYPRQDIYYMKGVGNGTSNTYSTTTVCPRDFESWRTYYPDAQIVGYADDVSCSTGQPWPYDTEQGYLVQYNYQTTDTYTPIYSIKSNYLNGMSGHYLQPVETGDFNGDGKAEVIQSLTGNRYAVFYFTDVIYDKDCSKLQKITDGLGNVTSISYNTLANGGTALYAISSDAENSYPYNTTSLPISVVRSVIQPDAANGAQTTYYAYQDAILHRYKGLLGFKGLTTSNDLTRVNTESHNELNKTINTMIPAASKSYLSNILASETRNNVNITRLPDNSTRRFAGVRYKYEINNTIEIDQISKSAKKTSHQYDGYGNVILRTAETGAWINNVVNAVETVSTSTVFEKAGKAIFPLQPTRVSVTSTRSGAAAITQSTSMSYTADRGLLASQTSWYGTPMASLTSYTYDQYGNVIQALNQVPNQSDVHTTLTYDASNRFATKTVVQRGSFTSIKLAAYDGYWGKPLIQTDGDGTTGSLTTAFEYDGFGNVKTTITPLGHRIGRSLAWDVSGSQLYYSFTDYPDGVGADEKIWFNNLGGVIKKQTLGWNNQWTTQTTRYDNRGRTTETTMPYYSGENILATSYAYDNLNRIIQEATPFGNTSYSYNLPGNGEATTTVTNPAGQSNSKTIDATGKVIATTDNGGTLAFSYNSSGNQTGTALNGQIFVSSIFDNYGRQTQLTDANAGTTNYEYNELGQITRQIDARGNISTISYDALERMVTKTTPEGSVVYEYFNDVTNKEIKKVTSPQTTEEYTYDGLHRIISKKQTVPGTGSFITGYEYDASGNQSAIIYPNNVRIGNRYNNSGMLTQLSNNGKVLYDAVNVNGLGQATQYVSANGIQTSLSYDRGIPTRFYTPLIQDLHYAFDQQTANLISRKDALRNNLEEFTYDNLNRLTGSRVNNVQQFSITYDGSGATRGNIISKTDVGEYTYQSGRPNAIAYISPVNPLVNAANSQLAIAHSSFQRPLHIGQDGKTLDLVYGINDERIKTVQVINGQTETRLFLNNYERQTLPDGTINEIIYVGGGNGLCAMIVNGAVFSVYSDYLGSITAVTDENGIIVAEQNFDAWGRKRNAGNWTYANVTQVPVWLIRGYTGHEDLPAFGLININARLYDPLTGRMLSPDNYVPTPYNTQGYNRYSYANNNPLVYTDPDGNIFGIDDLVLGVIGGIINVGTQLISGNVTGVWQGFQYFGVGFAAGVVSEYTLGVGSGLIIGAGNAWVAGATGEQILTSAVIGGVSAGVGSSLSGLISPYVSSLTSGLGATASSVATEITTSTVVGGALGAGIAGLTGGDAGAGFRSGLVTGFAGGALNAGVGLGKSYLDGRRQAANTPSRELEPVDVEKIQFERPSIREQAIDIQKNLNNGKNSITIKTPSGHTRYDLAGDDHFGIETPHTKVYTRHTGPNGRFNYTAPKHPHPMTQQEIRLVRKFLQRSTLINKLN